MIVNHVDSQDFTSSDQRISDVDEAGETDPSVSSKMYSKEQLLTNPSLDVLKKPRTEMPYSVKS